MVKLFRMQTRNLITCSLLLAAAVPFITQGQSPDEIVPKERKFYSVTSVPIPDSVKLEVGGMAFGPDGRLAVCTRRGEVWLIEDPYQKKSKTPRYTRFARGLHEALGLGWRNGELFVTQRSELTKLTDVNRDGKADLYQTVASWPISGNYHEYSYGPLFMPNGDMLVNLNLSWVGKGESLTKWRGWIMRVKPDGKLVPYAAGMRSPAGYGTNAEGDVFYAENQGDWIGSGRITHIEDGDFGGHPASLNWSQEAISPLKFLKRSQFPDSIGSLHAYSKKINHFKEPTIIFPHTLMGISTSGLLAITNDAFGPFRGQMLVGDQGHSKVMRAFYEKVNGKYQGACFPFLEGFASGILRMAWGSDNSLFVGMTSRGWAATGKDPYGLQRVSYKGAVPFEIRTMKARSNGFELEFTKPVNARTAADPSQYRLTGFTYLYHKTYGSPVVDQQDCPVRKVEVSADGRTVRLYVSGLREGYVHALEVPNLTAQSGEKVLHPVGYYTLNNIPAATEADKQAMTGMEHMDHKAMAGTSPGGCGTNSAKNRVSRPVEWGGRDADVTIELGTRPGLKFDKELFDVPEGARVKLVFSNNDDMLHNFVVTAPGKGQDVGKAAMGLGLNGASMGYIPASDDVLFNTCLLQPQSSQTIYFVAPRQGEYPFICSFPGHYMVMKGIMKVSAKK